MPELDGQALASTLDPQLHQACHGRLGQISWFRATWQHGGAGTGFSTWSLPDRTCGHREIPCVVKMPVGYSEYFWTKRLGLIHPDEWEEPSSLALPTPRVLAAGFELGGYDLAWVVMERFANPPIAMERTESSMWALFETAAEFHAAAILEKPLDLSAVKPPQDWNGLVEKGIEALEANEIENRDRWLTVLKQAQGSLDGLIELWANREIDTWCHHDLHPHNAMRRATDDSKIHGHCTLIDLAMVGPGSWIEDALYMERLFWGREQMLCNIDPLKTLASTRESIGLPCSEESFELADVRRVLMAASAPAFLRTEGDSVYLNAALSVIERLLPRFIG
ncbi:MAG: phosphotransferase [Phycisphaerales bacterium]|nr:phosphotransferase [Phycisphaerales bacterium]